MNRARRRQETAAVTLRHFATAAAGVNAHEIRCMASLMPDQANRQPKGGRAKSLCKIPDFGGGRRANARRKGGSVSCGAQPTDNAEADGQHHPRPAGGLGRAGCIAPRSRPRYAQITPCQPTSPPAKSGHFAQTLRRRHWQPPISSLERAASARPESRMVQGRPTDGCRPAGCRINLDWAVPRGRRSPGTRRAGGSRGRRAG